MNFTKLSDIISGLGVKAQKNTKAFQDSSLSFFQIIELWPTIVGPKLSKFSIPLKIRHGELIIITSHPIFSEQLSFLEKKLLEQINLKVPSYKKLIKGVSFQVSPDYFRELTQTQITQERRPPSKNHLFSPKAIALRKEADELFQGIEDKELKELLTSLYVQEKNS